MSKKTDALSKLGEFFPPVNKSGYSVQPAPPAEPRSFGLRKLQSRLTPDGSIAASDVPLVAPVRLPTMKQRIALYEQAGAVKQMMYDPEGSEDDWFDHLDDLPEEGLSPYELSESDIAAQAEFARKVKKAAQKRVDKRKASDATPPAGGAVVAPTKQAEATPAAPKGGD